MQDASQKCMKKCKAGFMELLNSLTPIPGESKNQTSARKKALLIDELIRSGCCDVGDRNRLDATPIASLIAELCGCKCSGYFPYKASLSDTDADSIEAVHPPPSGGAPP